MPENEAEVNQVFLAAILIVPGLLFQLEGLRKNSKIIIPRAGFA
jgi:hypothetical protein